MRRLLLCHQLTIKPKRLTLGSIKSLPVVDIKHLTLSLTLYVCFAKSFY